MQNDPFVQIRKEKRRLRCEIEECRASIVAQAREMASPVPKATAKMQLASKVIGRGMAVMQGVLIGIKAFRSLQKIFRKR